MSCGCAAPVSMKIVSAPHELVILRGCDFFNLSLVLDIYIVLCILNVMKNEVEGSSSSPAEDPSSQPPVRLRKPERRQSSLGVQCVKDLVPADHPVRRVAEVVATLDLSQFRAPIRAREGVVGRDATDPELLVALWLYACIRGIGSARELARRCAESLPFIWLCGGVGVNHRLLSDFRTDRGAALDDLFTQVLAILMELDIVKVTRISQDGMRVRVGAGASSYRREGRVQELVAEAQAHVQALREQVEHPEQLAEISARQKAAR